MRQVSELNKLTPSPLVSSKYKMIQTGQLVEMFERNGYQVSRILEQGYAKNSPNQGYGKHLIRLRHPSFDLKIDGLYPEIVIQNSYDGKSSFKISLGVFRIVCSNGLVAGSSFANYKVNHVGNANDLVLTACQDIQKQVAALSDTIKKFQSVNLTLDQQLGFAKTIAELVAPKNAFNIQHQDLLSVRRNADVGQNLWTVLNRIQENVLRGGLRYQYEKLTSIGIETRNNSTRRINAITKNVLLNKKVWDLAERLAVWND